MFAGSIDGKSLYVTKSIMQVCVMTIFNNATKNCIGETL